jgi:hypothetical protein
VKRNTRELAYCYRVFCQHYQYSKDLQKPVGLFLQSATQKVFSNNVIYHLFIVIRYSLTQSDHIMRSLDEKEGKVEQK